jgi:2-keto-3-deoxy-6-phosphogluconate aldolase
MASYLESSLIAGLGGSWLAPRDLIQAEKWDQIEANARAAAEVVKQVRSR